VLLESIEASNFRNLAGSLSFSDGLNILAGENGHGKTNWLESIYLLASTRSFRTSRLHETVRFNESLAIVKGVVRESPEITRELQVAIEGNTKLLSINGKKRPPHDTSASLRRSFLTLTRLRLYGDTPKREGGSSTMG
jgi:DNA replication and repair protein RecF